VIAGNPGFARHPWPSLSLSPRYAMPCHAKVTSLEVLAMGPVQPVAGPLNLAV